MNKFVKNYIWTDIIFASINQLVHWYNSKLLYNKLRPVLAVLYWSRTLCNSICFNSAEN